MSRNEAAERLRLLLHAHRNVMVAVCDREEPLLDEALATERRLTVERVRERVLAESPLPAALPRWLRSILDDLATADVDEEDGDD